MQIQEAVNVVVQATRKAPLTADEREACTLAIQLLVDRVNVANKFETELQARGLKSLMPEQAYKDPNYKWDYSEGD